MHNFRLKYAPETLADVVFPSQDAKQVITDMVELKRLNHLLLYGPCGTGKTTVAELIPEAALGDQHAGNVFKFDADALSSVDVVRNKLMSFVKRIPLGDTQHKFVIIDEVDGLSLKAQQTLRGVMNSADKTGTIFIMTTNYLDKIEGGVQSRCECIKFADFDPNLWLPRAKYICQQEGIVIKDDNDLLKIISDYGSDTRALMGKLEQVVRQANASVV